MSDTQTARDNMIKQQLRTWEVRDKALLAVMAELPREYYLPQQYAELAYSDVALPVSHSQEIFPPKEVGRIVQALALSQKDTVLVFGAHDRYLISVLAKLSKHVTVVENQPEFIEPLEALKLANITLLQGDITIGWRDSTPYDVIVLAGSVPKVNQDLLGGLKNNGRLFAVVGNLPVMTATLFARTETKNWDEAKLFETVHSRLSHVIETDLFKF